MSLRIVSRAPSSTEAVVLFRGSRRLPPEIEAELERRWLRGPVAATATLGRMDAPLVVGIDPPGEPGSLASNPLAVARIAGAAGRALIDERVSRAVLELPDWGSAATESALLGLGRALYKFDRYKSEKGPDLPRVSIVASKEMAAVARRALLVVEGITLARDLVNTPAEDMGPDQLEAAARSVARAKRMRIRVLDAARCRSMGLGALLAVGRASERQPRMIVLEYRGDARSKSFLAIAGKGICFDTGGLNVKPAGGMLLMKKDMAGAAAALGAAQAVAAVAPRRNVRFFLAVAENSISGNALRPGDVVRALDGTTIEVGNTDAEGRLVLADAVALARREGAARIVDVATLTGAAMVALGRVRVPLLGNDEQLLADIEASATATAERVWRMPTDQEYRDGIRGEVADLRNVGPAGEYGVMAGGLFVGHFAGDLPWAHLDISPASWAPAPSEFGPGGATGVMVSTLARLACGSTEEGAPVVRMPRRSSTPKRAPRSSSKASSEAGRAPRRRRTG